MSRCELISIMAAIIDSADPAEAAMPVPRLVARAYEIAAYVNAEETMRGLGYTPEQRKASHDL